MSPKSFLQALCVVIIWGFNFVAIKVAVTEVPPLSFTIVRFMITGIVLIPFFRLTKEQIIKIIPFSFVLGFGHFGLICVGLKGVDAATSALLIQLGVPFSSILAALFLTDKLGWKRGFGMVMAFCGAAFLVGEPQGGSIFSISVLLVSAFCWAWANILMKLLLGIPPLAVIGWMGVMVSPFLVLLSYFTETGQIDALLNASLTFWSCISYTIVASSIISYFLWYSLISRHDVNQIVPFTLLTPMIGVAAAIMILGEDLSIYKIVGGMFTLFGVGIIQFRQMKKPLQLEA